MTWTIISIVGWAGLFVGVCLLALAILMYVKRGNKSKRQVLKAGDKEVKPLTQTATLTKLDTSERKLDFSEAVEAGDSRVDSMRFRGRQKRTGKNIEKETATLKKVKEAMEVGVDIEKTKVEGYKTIGEYDKLPPHEKQEVELTQKQTETKMMKEDYEQEKIKQDLEVLKNKKPVEKQEENLSEVEKMTQDLSEKEKTIKTLRKMKAEKMAQAETEEDKINIERMYEDKILEVRDR